MRIRTRPDFQIQCILYGKWQSPDCAVRIAVKRLLPLFSVAPAAANTAVMFSST